ncbi:aquaporin [Amantichitinum ursilacus]|uniref:Aquaporin Z 2 n=1 Tax=Amantichitinum ursilacus TaxID=857265 RepID=A0A0N0XLN8_9NEIS|nr:aquaporin [Amantichitinum ursilacus]KPC53471.1 Aquaporin Z 2 [Amantichitinum ursilacus]
MFAKHYLAEFFGTLILVLFGCGAAVFAGPEIGHTGIAFAFGLAIVTVAYGFGHWSGAHVNPAVTLGVLIAGRMRPQRALGYIVAQCLGAMAGAAIIYLIATGQGGTATQFGQNQYADGALQAALVFEFVATLIFVSMILGVTSRAENALIAGVAIGLTLTAIHLVGIPLTGTSVNPARSLGPALFAGGIALSQLWLFLLAPAAAGVIAGMGQRLLERP